MLSRSSRARNSAQNPRIASAITPLSALALIQLASPAQAYLGSFTPADGYQIIQPWVDVSYFNTGQYGANAGGGSVNYVAPDSGLWKVTGPVGGIYTSAAARAAATSGAPPYAVTPPVAGSAPVYIVGNHGPGRTDNSALAFRNDTPANTGAAKYDYSIDTYDTGGIAPSTVTSGIVTTQFYFCPNPADPVVPGALPRDKFTMSFKDSSGNTGFQWGYAAENQVYWRTGTSGPWTYTGVFANAANWDGVRVDIDLTNDTFGLDYYVVASNIWQNMIPAGTALGTPMTNLTNLGWQLEDNVFTGTGGKNFFDDFSFNVPAPSVVPLLALGGLVGARRRRH